MNQEVVFKYRTRGNSSPKDKPKVYFTCHPEDFDRYFDKVCEDIFKTHDCAIYYTEDMTANLSNENNLVDLERMNLFVIPITFRLLTKPNRAMDSDFRFAMNKHIPVLPIMMEYGIDEFYSKPDRFGELQYINPFSHDFSEISYEEKLKKHLESVLISDELAQRVRDAFDAYIFLSYRKKDRAYANELMRLIHKNPECRDIAIWFDEFLTPGESFKENIDKILQNSELFTLLVTPNLLERPNGKPNFVMGEEYPAAKNAGKYILPAEMEKTDKQELNDSFSGIPDCVDVYNDAVLKKRLLDSIKHVAISANNDDPEHNYLIGLAYLEGIDVEVDVERGLALITSSGEAGLLEAINMLCSMYYGGEKIPLDYRKALYWTQKLVEYNIQTLGETHQDTLISLNDIAIIYSKIGEDRKARKTLENVCEISCKTLGEDHLDTLMFLNSLSIVYANLGDYCKALELAKKTYSLRCKTLGKEHEETLVSLNSLAFIYGKLGNYRKELEIYKKTYNLRCEILGNKHPDTLVLLNHIAYAYGKLGDYHKAIEIQETVYEMQCEIVGEDHPNTLETLGDLAVSYGNLNNPQKALELQEKIYAIRRKKLGLEHPDTLTVLNNLAITEVKLGNYHKALRVFVNVYKISCLNRGKNHPDTIMILNNIAVTCGKLGEYQKELELEKKIYAIRRNILGDEHPDTLMSLNNLAVTYGVLGDKRKELDLQEMIYAYRCKILGEEHEKTQRTAQIIKEIKEKLNLHL